VSTIAIELPERLTEQLRQELVSDEKVSEAVTEAIEEWLESRRQKARSERERAIGAIETAGLNLKTSWEEWNELFTSTPVLTAEEVRQMMTGVSPLSEDIIAERDEGR
jgi:Arc/MetJ-type ribon-helix-helix transcriptional regulator